MRDAVLQVVMKTIQSALLTQMKNAFWSQLHAIPESQLELLAVDVAANATGSLIDVCGICGATDCECDPLPPRTRLNPKLAPPW